ncbi:MAG: tRNA (N6-isopentenyl adenosine(37)-C2)-methylthiotransferase MiaB [Spirochaetia bacterium]|jgi:tRNA-2-methylthio-N6-dimethylallyladenosine synthase|nr:tRNA (N6-isopentenyl adenosine(37)-C2)-methylthiotransferase MiaB [Spirochaetia bacterium]
MSIADKPVKVASYLIETYGCQMNVAESNALETQLQGIGLTKARCAEEADLVVLNTCSVRQTAENRIWGRLGFYSRLKKERPMYLVVTGCMAERLSDQLKKEAPYVDYVLGTNDKQEILEIAQGMYEDEKATSYHFQRSYYKEGDLSTYVPIMNGCNNFCSYCIVPYVRGREVSRPLSEILTEVRFLSAKGVKEITLLGQNVNSYAYEDATGRKVNFPVLLEAVCTAAEGVEWIRFESPHPKDFSESLIQVIQKEPRVAKHLHIPLQSGSSRILQLMNRKYDREQFISLIQRIKEEIPSVTFSTDVMVGFPGETEEDYMETRSLLELMRCTEAFMYYWNPREGTRAVKMDGQLSEETKGERLRKLIDRQQIIFHEEKTARASGTHRILVTGVSRNDEKQFLGRGEHNEMVAFTPIGRCVRGEVVAVSYTGVNGNTMTGFQAK